MPRFARDGDSLEICALTASLKTRLLDRAGLRALLAAKHFMSIAFGTALSDWRSRPDHERDAVGQRVEASYQLPLALSAAKILGERWSKVPERRRPHYTPSQRFEILKNRAALVLSVRETAAVFAVAESTIYEWESLLRTAQEKDPGVRQVGERIVTVPPIRRFADAVRHLVLFMSQAGIGGQDKVAETMARLGFRLSGRTVGRIRNEKRVPPDTAAKASDSQAAISAKAKAKDSTQKEEKRLRAVDAKAPLEKVHIDLTQVRALFALLTFRIAVVFDVFSRLPLAFGVWPTEPSALDVVKLLERAMVFGKPKVLITDQGSVFTNDLLRAAVRTLGIEHRFGALYQHGSIARLERFWRSLKSLLYHHALFHRLVVRDLDRDVQLALVHYSFFRPHSGLKGATPAEVFLQLPPAHLAAVPPPRGKPGQAVPFQEHEVEFLAPGLPVFRRKAA